jgi:hypothetical protein
MIFTTAFTSTRRRSSPDIFRDLNVVVYHAFTSTRSCLHAYSIMPSRLLDTLLLVSPVSTVPQRLPFYLPCNSQVPSVSRGLRPVTHLNCFAAYFLYHLHIFSFKSFTLFMTTRTPLDYSCLVFLFSISSLLYPLHLHLHLYISHITSALPSHCSRIAFPPCFILADIYFF